MTLASVGSLKHPSDAFHESWLGDPFVKFVDLTMLEEYRSRQSRS